MNDRHTPITCKRVGVALLGLLLLTASAVTASAAGSTAVSLQGTGTGTDVGGTTTVDVVVGNADGGVGVYNATVAVDDPDVASITDVELAGDPGLDEVEIADDGSRVSIRAALMNTTDAGAVTIATITLAGDAAGSSDVSLSVTTLGDEEGRAYSVSETRGSSVAVSEDDDDDDDDSSSDSADASSTDRPTATPDGTSTADSSVDPTGTSSPVTTTPSAESPPTSPEEDSGSSLLPTSLLNVALVAGAVLVTGLLLARRIR